MDRGTRKYSLCRQVRNLIEALVDSKPPTPHRRHFSFAPLVSLAITDYVSTYAVRNTLFSFFYHFNLKRKGHRSSGRIALRDCETLSQIYCPSHSRGRRRKRNHRGCWLLRVTGLALCRDPDSWVLGILEENKKALLTPESTGAAPLIVILRYGLQSWAHLDSV